MSYFNEVFVDPVRIGQTGYLFFLDDRGMLIAHPEKKLILNKDIVPEIKNISSQVIAGKSAFVADYKGMDRFYVTQKIDIPEANILHQWFMVFSQSDDEISALSRNFLKILGGLGIVFIGLFSAGMVVLTRLVIERPVNRIAETLRNGVRQTSASAEQVAAASEGLLKALPNRPHPLKRPAPLWNRWRR